MQEAGRRSPLPATPRPNPAASGGGRGSHTGPPVLTRPPSPLVHTGPPSLLSTRGPQSSSSHGATEPPVHTGPPVYTGHILLKTQTTKANSEGNGSGWSRPLRRAAADRGHSPVQPPTRVQRGRRDSGPRTVTAGRCSLRCRGNAFLRRTGRAVPSRVCFTRGESGRVPSRKREKPTRPRPNAGPAEGVARCTWPRLPSTVCDKLNSAQSCCDRRPQRWVGNADP